MQASGLTGSPFAVLTAVVAPAILTNACSVLALGTSNRIARVVDRTRAISAELTTIDRNDKRFKTRLEQIDRLRDRANLLVRSLRMFYIGMGCFAAAALLTVLGSTMAYYDIHDAFQIIAGFAFGVGLAGVASLVNGSMLTVRETRLAFALLHEEVDEVLKERSS